MYQDFGGAAYQCTWWANARIYQLTGFQMGAWGDGACYGSVAMANGYAVYGSYQEALEAKGTLAGLVMSMGIPYSSYPNCGNYSGCGALGSSNHVAICEGYDSETGTIYVSEMWGSIANGDILLNSYSRSSYSSCIQWIDLNVEATGGGGGYFKDKFGEFHWPVKPETDARFPTSSEYQEFCDRLNEAQEEAGVEDPTKFSATQDNNVLTAARFNEYLHLMQESTEGNLRGVDDEVELMDDVEKDDVIYAKHFLQLEDLYNHWMYGTLQSGTDVPMNGSFAERIWDYLRSLGYSEMGAAGIIGNIAHECGSNDLNLIDPTIVNHLGCYGIVQWCPYPWSDHFNLGGMYVGMPFEDQLRYLGTNSYGSIQNIISKSYVNGNLRSCGTTAYNELKNSNSIYEATKIFFNCYEGAGDSSLSTRQTLAYKAYAAFSGRPLWTPTPPAGGGATGNWIFPLTYYTGCQCRRGEVYVGATDLAAPNGTEIHAIDGGIVDISWIWQGGIAGNNSYGNFVRIDHGNGWKSLYAHMNSAPLVSYGQSVSQGTLLGYVGHTGNSDGDHLHLEVISSDGVRHCASEVFGMYCPWT